MAFNELKRRAKGDAKIPADQRVYLHVEAAATSATPSPSPPPVSTTTNSPHTYTNTTTTTKPHTNDAINKNDQTKKDKDKELKAEILFFNKSWSVGRSLDVAARSLQVENVNNRGGGEDDRLRVYHVEGGRMLDFGEKMADAVRDGNTIVLLRGIGPPPPSSSS